MGPLLFCFLLTLARRAVRIRPGVLPTPRQAISVLDGDRPGKIGATGARFSPLRRALREPIIAKLAQGASYRATANNRNNQWPRC